jgi:hypothetical protein
MLSASERQPSASLLLLFPTLGSSTSNALSNRVDPFSSTPSGVLALPSWLPLPCSSSPATHETGCCISPAPREAHVLSPHAPCKARRTAAVVAVRLPAPLGSTLHPWHRASVSRHNHPNLIIEVQLLDVVPVAKLTDLHRDAKLVWPTLPKHCRTVTMYGP